MVIALVMAAAAVACASTPASPAIVASNPASPTTASVPISGQSTQGPSTQQVPTEEPSGGSASPGTTAPTGSAAGTGGVPGFDHVYVIVMENRGYESIVASPDAPYINSLIANYGLATNYDAIAHPSQPNYIALFAGSTLGVTGDGHYDLEASNVADQIDAAGKSWLVYAQNYPGNCSPASSASGGVDLTGLAGSYFRKHNPAISFTDISGQPARCAAITSLASFDPSAASFELIVPNIYNDMHSASTRTGDDFLKGFVPLITNSTAFANSLLVITWDEGISNVGGGGQVATIVVSPVLASGGMQSDVSYNHYSLLRTIEDGLGLPCLVNSCQATALSDFFR